MLQASRTSCAIRYCPVKPHWRWPDGVSREVYLINGQLPGPLIDVDEGDDIEVFVTNELPVNMTIHWHGESHTIPLLSYITRTCRWEYRNNIEPAELFALGLLQRGSPQMDGVPGVTQVSPFPLPSLLLVQRAICSPGRVSTQSRQEVTSLTDSPRKASTASTGITRTSEPIPTTLCEAHSWYVRLPHVVDPLSKSPRVTMTSPTSFRPNVTQRRSCLPIGPTVFRTPSISNTFRQAPSHIALTVFWRTVMEGPNVSPSPFFKLEQVSAWTFPLAQTPACLRLLHRECPERWWAALVCRQAPRCKRCRWVNQWRVPWRKVIWSHR